jgi:hypothetical protein
VAQAVRSEGVTTRCDPGRVTPSPTTKITAGRSVPSKVEILSPGNSRTEMKDKFELYQEAGVLEYWVVSPIEKTIQVWKLTEQGTYIGLQPKVEGDVVTTPIVPKLEVDVSEVFMD